MSTRGIAGYYGHEHLTMEFEMQGRKSDEVDVDCFLVENWYEVYLNQYVATPVNSPSVVESDSRSEIKALTPQPKETVEKHKITDASHSYVDAITCEPLPTGVELDKMGKFYFFQTRWVVPRATMLTRHYQFADNNEYLTIREKELLRYDHHMQQLHVGMRIVYLRSNYHPQRRPSDMPKNTYSVLGKNLILFSSIRSQDQPDPHHISTKRFSPFNSK